MKPTSQFCRAGHPLAWRKGRAHAASGPIEAVLAVDYEDVVAAQPFDQDEVEKREAPPWRARAAFSSGFGAAAAYSGLWAAGAHDALAMGVVTALGCIVPYVASWSTHRDKVDELAHEDEHLARYAELGRRHGAGMRATRTIAETLDRISSAHGREKDELRGELMSTVVHALGKTLPEGSAVALYRVTVDGLEPTSAQAGWATHPPRISADSPIYETLVGLVSEQSVEHRASRGGRDRIIAPVRSGSTMFGAIVAEAPSNGAFDGADVDFVWASATLLGSSQKDTVTPIEEEWPAPDEALA